MTSLYFNFSSEIHVNHNAHVWKINRKKKNQIPNASLRLGWKSKITAAFPAITN